MRQTATRVVVLGAGGHGHVVVDALQSLSDDALPVEVVAVLDDTEALRGTSVGGLIVRGGRALLASIPHEAVVVAVGDNRIRRGLQEELVAGGETLWTVRHRSAVVSRHSALGPGVVVCAGTVVGPMARVGAGTIVNTGAQVDHHCEIGDFVHIAPGATLSGGVFVGAESLIGANATVLPGIRVGVGVTIGAGSVVCSHLVDGVTVVGIPAREVTQRPGIG